MTEPFFHTSTSPPGIEAAIKQPVTLCPGNAPLVLLPVRLETRFFPVPDGAAELRIRIYPDKIHIDSHEPTLTPAEREAGARYWDQDWRAGADNAARLAAWRELAMRCGTERAAWIVRTLVPTNLAQRPAEATLPSMPLSPTPALPAPGPPPRGAENAWRQAPKAQLMPDRWVAVLHVAGQAPLVATGPDVSRPLAVGPDPSPTATESPTPALDQVAIDPDMQWLVDFDAALACGMALRVAVPPTALAAGLDSLLVFGVAASLSAPAAASALADLLDAHQYTDGLEFLAPGTATNNTEERRAGGGSADTDHAISFERAVQREPSSAPNARRLGRSLGLSDSRAALSLGRIGQATRDHDRDAQSMNTALWSVGWGYFLSNLVGVQTGLSVPAMDWVRGHARDFVRACGPFAPLRFGSQPYGVLPVSSLNLWTPGAQGAAAGLHTQLRDLLLALREQVWRPAVSQVPRIGLRQSPPDPDADLADLMRIDGVSQRARLRGVMGRHTLEHLYALTAQSFGELADSQQAVAARLLQRLGLPVSAQRLPALARLFFEPSMREVTAPLVQVGEGAAGRPLQPDYIGSLLEAPTVQSLIDLHPVAGCSLLQALLRHALLREYANAAARLVATLPGQDLAVLLRDAELVDMVDSPVVDFQLAQPAATLHWQRQLDMRVPAFTGSATVRQFLQSPGWHVTAELSELRQMREAMEHLRTLDIDCLTVLLQSTLDLGSHRLDAWITSLATQRLAEMTSPSATGTIVGGYGWVENLQPAAAAAMVPPQSLPPGEPGPLYTVPTDSGFIHAPSFNHAAAAALLRNAHLGPSGRPSSNDPFSIQLSSRRAKDAAWLLGAVRQGQPLGALLGYRLERRLHELQLDRFIAPLRALAPLDARLPGVPAAEGATALPASPAIHVLDGLALLRRRQDPPDALLEQALQAASPDQRIMLERELAALDDALDGLGDALTAETAYQLARGNPSRLASTLATVTQGETPPAELEVIQAHRSGTAITHRMLVLMSGGPQTGPGWMASASSPLAGSERMLNAWVSRLLGDATKVRCTVERFNPQSGEVVQAQSFALAELALTPLDFVHFAQVHGASGAEAGATSYVEQLVLYHARRRSGGFGAVEHLRLQHARTVALTVGESTLFDVLEQARAVRWLFEGVRAVRPDDFGHGARGVNGTVDLGDLEARVVRAENLLATAHRTLASLIAAGVASAAEPLRTAMLGIAAFGVTQAVPCVALGDTSEGRAALLRQGAALLMLSQARLDRGVTLRAQALAPQAQARCDQLLERGRAVFGERFVLLPTFTMDAEGGTELKSALAGSTQIQGGDSLQAHAWLARSARVRDACARLADCMRGAEALGAGDRLSLAVAQLPLDLSQRWVGLPPLPGTSLALGKLSLVVQAATSLNPTLPMCGLLVDEWVEVVPSREETTAIAFQLDPPNSCAPQNILIAVPPVPGADWTTETLRQVLAETLDLAKLRGVHPGLLGDAAQYLPATVLAFNAADDAVSTNLSALAG